MEWFDKLKIGIILTVIKGEIRIPQNYALGRVPKGYGRWSIAQEYLIDLERIIKELSLAVSLVSKPPSDEFLLTHKIRREDYLMYHHGYFLDLSHQAKDKIAQLVRAVTIYSKTYSYKEVPKRKLLNKLLNDPAVKRIPGLFEALNKWNDKAVPRDALAKLLILRTEYHHFKNPLPRIDSYFKASSRSAMLDKNFTSMLTDYGKELLSKEADEYYLKWQQEGATKLSENLALIKGNVDDISRALVMYYHFPEFVSDFKLMKRYMGLWEQIRVQSIVYKQEPVPKMFKAVINSLINALLLVYGTKMEAVYVIGSVLRDDFIPGYSDINIIFVGDLDLNFKVFLDRLCKPVKASLHIKISSIVLTLAELDLPINEKIKFLCYSEGYLVHGKPIVSKPENINISFDLGLMLTRDYREHLAKAKSVVDDLSINLSEDDLIEIGRDIAKSSYWVSFTLVIGNNVMYTSNFKKMRELLNFHYPNNKAFNEVLYKMTRRRFSITRSTLAYFLKRCEENMLPAVEMMEKYCDPINPVLEDKFNE